MLKIFEEISSDKIKYVISDEGYVERQQNNKNYRYTVNARGYIKIRVNRHTKTYHLGQLVLSTFTNKKKDKKNIKYKDGNPLNFCLDNMQWNDDECGICMNKNTLIQSICECKSGYCKECWKKVTRCPICKQDISQWIFERFFLHNKKFFSKDQVDIIFIHLFKKSEIFSVEEEQVLYGNDSYPDIVNFILDITKELIYYKLPNRFKINDFIVLFRKIFMYQYIEELSVYYLFIPIMNFLQLDSINQNQRDASKKIAKYFFESNIFSIYLMLSQYSEDDILKIKEFFDIDLDISILNSINQYLHLNMNF